VSPLSDYRIIGPLTYRGKEGCRDVTCTRRWDITDRCYGWHCVYCDEACSYQGHNCPASEAILGEAARLAADTSEEGQTR
jgi:hypothetical protein